MKKIVCEEHKPFSYINFLYFKVDEKGYTPKYGTIRNKFSKFLKQKTIELCYRSKIAFYTLPGIKFGKDKLMTEYHTEDHTAVHTLLQNHPLYKVLETAYWDRQAIHNLHIVFKVKELYTLLSNNQLLNKTIHPKNKSIKFKTYFFERCTIIVSIYTTDTVKVIIGCSENPITLDYNGILLFTSLLTRIEERLQHDIESYDGTGIIALPSFKEWKIVLWHIGRDSLTEYSKEMFHCKWDLVEKIAMRIYSKQIHKHKIIRAELQFNPDISVKELIMRIILNSSTENT